MSFILEAFGAIIRQNMEDPKERDAFWDARLRSVKASAELAYAPVVPSPFRSILWSVSDFPFLGVVVSWNTEGGGQGKLKLSPWTSAFYLYSRRAGVSSQVVVSEMTYSGSSKAKQNAGVGNTLGKLFALL